VSFNSLGPSALPSARLARRATFSSSHRLWRDDWSPEKNASVYGCAASSWSHGHNYELEVCIAGPIDSVTGMLVDLKWLKQVIAREVEARFDHRDLNEDTPYFASVPPTAEHFGQVIFGLLEAALGRELLDVVRLRPTGALEVEVGSVVRVRRKYGFSAAHVLARAEWDQARNEATYGKCANPAGHGHNYVLEVVLKGQPDPVSGRLIPLHQLDRIVEGRVLSRLDHRFLNREVVEFQQRVPTAENIARFAWEALCDAVAPAKLDSVRLIETENNSVEYCAGERER